MDPNAAFRVGLSVIAEGTETPLVEYAKHDF